MKAFIDPIDNILYKSFYIYALQQCLGKDNVSFNSSYFTCLSKESRNTWSMRFITEDNGTITKYYISCNDSYCINEELYDWCDIYGGVNVNFALTPDKYHEKLVSLCPSFGINIYSFPELIYQSIRSLPSFDLRKMKKSIGQYKRLYFERPSYHDYKVSVPTKDNYIFFCSTLWYNDQWNHNDAEVNLRRATFVRACHELKNINFEGGLVPQSKGRSSEELFSDCLCRPYSMKEWLNKTKESILVFNTPAFLNCHGWKLGEFFALGKAIISTELSNDLPAPLIHGENIHYVGNNLKDMKDAIDYIASHPDYRKKLENGARQYWDSYGAPKQTIKLLGIDRNE